LAGLIPATCHGFEARFLGYDENLSACEVGWRNGRPYVIWDSAKFPAKRLRSAADREDGDR